MHILCAICQDGIDQANDIFCTPCGHVFHFPCLTQWLGNSLTCPQCRQKCKRDKVTRLFFTFGNVEDVKEDPFSLQQKVDNLQFNLKLLEKNLNNAQEEKAELSKQAAGLRDHARKVEREVTHNKSAIHALQEQIMIYKDRCKELDIARTENEKLKKRIEDHKNIEQLLVGSADDVDELMSNCRDPSTLTTYISIMKREMNNSNRKRKELRDRVKEYHSDLEFQKAAVKSLKEQNSELKKTISKYQVIIGEIEKPDSLSDWEDNSEAKHDNVKKPVKHEKKVDLAKVPEIKSNTHIFKIPKKTDDETDINDSVIQLSDSDRDDSLPKIVGKKDVKSSNMNSPYLLTKSKSILSGSHQTTERGTFSLGKKRPLSLISRSEKKISQEASSTLSYDGFGGHSKVEDFPRLSAAVKSKKAPVDKGKYKKIKLDNCKIDGYINLT